MTTFVSITGTPKTGIAVLKQDGSISNLDKVEPAALWGRSRAKGTLSTYASIMTGGPNNTTTVAQESSIEYLSNLGNPKSAWKPIDPALPINFKIMGVVGDPSNGFTALDTDGKTIYHVNAESKEWKALSAPLPFNGQVAFISGDNSTAGILLVNNEHLSALARSSADGTSWTALKPAAPIKIELITGNFIKGFVAFGEGQLYKLAIDKDAAVWTTLPTPEFDFVALSGNPADGIAALIKDSSGDANLVVYSNSINNGPWSLALMASRAA